MQNQNDASANNNPARLNGLSCAAADVLATVRQESPWRRDARPFSVRGTFQSAKMGRSIYYTCEQSELPELLALESSSEIKEIYSQPPPLVLRFHGVSGKKASRTITPSFFVVRTDGTMGWIECHREAQLVKLAERYPELYRRGFNGRFESPAAQLYAAKHGVTYTLLSTAGYSMTRSRNLTFLRGYWRSDAPKADLALLERVRAILKTNEGITLNNLASTFAAEECEGINILISCGLIHADMESGYLAYPRSIFLYTSIEALRDTKVLEGVIEPKVLPSIRAVTIAPWCKVNFNGAECTVVELAGDVVHFLTADMRSVPMRSEMVEAMIADGRIKAAAPAGPLESIRGCQVRILSAEARTVALNRYNRIKKFLPNPYTGLAPRGTSKANSTERSWIQLYHKAQECGSNGFDALAPRRRKGNNHRKTTDSVEAAIQSSIKTHYEIPSRPSILNAWQQCLFHWNAADGVKPTYATYTRRVNERDRYKQDLVREGEDQARRVKPPCPLLEWPREFHGQRPNEVSHMDHTQLDIEVVCSRTGKNLGRPWLTVLFDSYSRRVMGIWLDFDGPSASRVLMTFRHCVSRNGVVSDRVCYDNATEFGSAEVQGFMARFGIDAAWRCVGEPQYGTLIERFFGTLNRSWLHDIYGNTQASRDAFNMTNEINPKHLAYLTLPRLAKFLDHFCFEIYNKREHSSLGTTPQLYYDRGLIESGTRLHRCIPNDSEFFFLTLPEARSLKNKKTARLKISEKGTVRLNGIEYSSRKLRSPAFMGRKVTVRYNPTDKHIIFVCIGDEVYDCVATGANWEEALHAERNLYEQIEELRRKVLSRERIAKDHEKNG